MPSGTPTTRFHLPTFADSDSPDLGTAGLGAILAAIDSALIKAGASSFQTPSTPPGTTSASYVMAGLAGSITPTATGIVVVTISGSIAGNLTNSTYSHYIAMGTGTAPANGVAAVGTALTQGQPAGKTDVPFSLTGRITGLTLGTAYWIDLAYATNVGAGGGATGPTAININAEERPG